MALALYGPGFAWTHSDFHQDETRMTDGLMKDAEAGKKGQAVKMDAGRWTLAATTDVPGGILIADVEAGTDQPCSVFLIRPGDLFHVKYTGTPDAGFVGGANAVALAADGMSVDSATVAGGAVAVLRVNTTNQTAAVYFRLRQFS